MVNIKSDISGKKKNKKTVVDLFVGDLALVHDCLIRNSFYLPVDVLTDTRYIIREPVVLTHKDFLLAVNDKIIYPVTIEGSVELVFRAKFVGISSRTDTLQNKTYTIAKVWYGEEPSHG